MLLEVQETILFNSQFSLLALDILEQETLCSQDYAIGHRLPRTDENEFEMPNTEETSARAN